MANRFWIGFILSIWLTAAATLASCIPSARTPLPPLPTNTPLPPTETPTPTTVWFPPTATPTLRPAPTSLVTPTIDLQPQLGALLLSDDFSDESHWQVGSLPAGRVALGKDELTIAVSQPGGYITSLFQNTMLTDFYLEVTASPSLCKNDDQYGLLLRATSAGDFYRFALTCNGQARVDKYFHGAASAPQPPEYSGAVPPGAPSLSRLGVLARGNELTFFSNDQFLFTVRDASLPGGSIGVFARSEGENAVTVNYSDMKIYEVSDE